MLKVPPHLLLQHSVKPFGDLGFGLIIGDEMVDPFSFQKGLKLTVEELGPRICLQPLRLTAQGLTDVSKGPNQAIPGLVLQGHDPSVLGQHVNDCDQVPIPIILTPTKLHVDQVRLPLVVNILDKNSARPEPTHHRPVARS